MNSIETKNLYDLTHTLAAPLLEQTTYPWEALAGISDFIKQLGPKLPKEIYEERTDLGENIWIAKSAKIAPTASITGPCIIGENTEVRHCAFVRGNLLAGCDDVIGNSTEIKNVILFDHVQVPHYNYVGDSILGYYAHMGAGSITSNVKSDKKLVVIHTPQGDIPTERKKVGALVGDYVEVGCGSILNPGTVIGRNASVYPLSSVRGVIPANGIYKKAGEVVMRTE